MAKVLDESNNVEITEEDLETKSKGELIKLVPSVAKLAGELD